MTIDHKRSKTVGILTFIDTLNYGAELQAYALCRSIQRLGWESELVNYTSNAMRAGETYRVVNQLNNRTIKQTINALLKYRELKMRDAAFRAFDRKELPLGNPVSNTDEVLSAYERLVVGSDQVWCPRITKNDLTFFLPGTKKDNQIIISYAASFGDSATFGANCEKIAGSIKAFDAVGVRESSGIEMAKRLGRDDARLNADPTLLLTRSDWMSAISDYPKKSEEYVFAYAVSERKRTFEYAKRAARALKVKLKYIDAYSGRPVINGENAGAASPLEFVGLISEASLVVTSSFHGVCLSALLNKPFRYVLPQNCVKSDSRIYNLVERLGLGQYDARFPPKLGTTDFEMADMYLERIREDSISYLERALSLPSKMVPQA